MSQLENQSPNQDARKLPITMLVLHYTGMETGQAAFERLIDPTSKVSAHYMVEEDGEIKQLVDEGRRAWHAGVSFWNGITDINSASVGIEIVNGGHDFDLPEFTRPQLTSVIRLSKKIVKAYNIPDYNIVGHSDIAPSRKQDPGEKFPWKEVAQRGVGYWPADVKPDQRVLFEQGSTDRAIAILQRGLAFIGYNVEVNGRLDANTGDVLCAFQRRYRPNQITGNIDIETVELITDLADNRKNEVGSAAVDG
jgi:N-acetylmuramoyl-L-alanine amidase